MIKISIIVPVYNSEKWIEKCIKSILSQSFENFELIIVDDGSKDSSLHVIQQYALKDNRIRCFHKENTGVSDTRNFGIKQATGEWITFVDSDDSLKSQCLEKLLPLKDDVFLTVCGAEIVKKDRVLDCFFRSGYEIADGIYPISAVYNRLVNQVFNGPYRKLFKRKLIVDNKIEFPKGKSYGEDTDFVYSYLKHVNEVQISSYSGYQINVVNADSLSEQIDAQIYYSTITHNYQLYKELLKKNNIDDTSYIEEYYAFNILLSISLSYWRKNGLDRKTRILLYKDLFARKAWTQTRFPFYFSLLGRLHLWSLIDFFRNVHFAIYITVLKIHRIMRKIVR